MELYFTFPNWKRKAVSFSYDDARVEDRRMVETFNKHGLKGTFNISPGRLGREGFIARTEVASLYMGHEVASHGYNHLHLSQLSPGDLRAELRDGRSALEDLLGHPVTGFASPYGDHTAYSMEAMREVGFAYARPVAATRSTKIPSDPLFWQASTHHDKDSVALAESFLANSGWGGTLNFLNIWGHSYEFERNGNWDLLDELCQLLAGRDEIWYCTNLEMREYMRATQAAKITLDGRVVENTAAFPLYANWGESHGTIDTVKVVLPPGKRIDLAAATAGVADGGTPIWTGATKVPGHFELAYPGWKRKALTFSYDDAPPGDRRLVEILNRHGMKGTFNINTHNRPETVPSDAPRDADGRLLISVAKDEWKSLYLAGGHEIALHGARHETFGSVPWPVVMEDMYRNKEVIEAELHAPVRGFAYPCGASSKTPEGDTILRALDVSYGRVTQPAERRFTLPADFLDWHPTAHHNAGIDAVGRDFLAAQAADEPLLCYIWGHSFEFDNAGNWDVLENFCALMEGHAEIWYATNIEIFDYVTAARQLVWSLKGDSVANPTATAIYGFLDGKPIEIAPSSAK